jgi:hypothetical protein
MDEAPYATEYAISGWFKWLDNSEQSNLLFRLSSSTALEEGSDGYYILGNSVKMVDGHRTLSTFTYSYAAEGRDTDSPLIEENIPQSDATRISKWHFVYVAYNREIRSVFSLAWFREGTA